MPYFGTSYFEVFRLRLFLYWAFLPSVDTLSCVFNTVLNLSLLCCSLQAVQHKPIDRCSSRFHCQTPILFGAPILFLKPIFIPSLLSAPSIFKTVLIIAHLFFLHASSHGPKDLKTWSYEGMTALVNELSSVEKIHRECINSVGFCPLVSTFSLPLFLPFPFPYLLPLPLSSSPPSSLSLFIVPLHLLRSHSPSSFHSSSLIISRSSFPFPFLLHLFPFPFPSPILFPFHFLIFLPLSSPSFLPFFSCQVWFDRVSHIRFFQIFAMKRIEANWSLIRWIFALIREYSYKNIRFNSLSFASKYSLQNKSTSKRRNIRFNSLRFASKYSLITVCVPVHINAACPCPQCMDVYAARPHVHSACLYCMSMSILHLHVFATCPCPWCMSRSVLQIHVHAAVHVHAASPCPCYQSMSMLYVHVLAVGT